MIPGLKKRSINWYDLMMYAALARKHFRLMALTFSMVMLLGLTYYVYARPVYHAQALILVNSLALPGDSDSVYKGTPGDVTIAQLTAAPIVERVAARLGVVADYEMIHRRYLKQLRVTQNSQRNLNVDIWAYKHDWAVRFTRLMVEEFIAYREEQRVSYREALLKSYTREMTQVGKKLDDSMAKRFAFEEEKEISQTHIKLNQLASVPQDLATVKKQISEIDRLRSNLDDPSLSNVAKLSLLDSFHGEHSLSLGQVIAPNRLPSSANPSGLSGSSNSSGPAVSMPPEKEAAVPSPSKVIVVPSLLGNEQRWQALDLQQRDIQSQIAQAAKIYLPGHRIMIGLQKQLKDVQGEIEREYLSARATFDVEYKSLLQKQADLEAKLPEYEEVNKRYTKLQQQFSFYQAGQLAWNSMYTGMAKELSAVDFSQDKERVNLSYDGLLDSKPFPDSPNRLRIFAIFFVLGIAASVGLPFGMEYLDHTISDFSEAESIFQLRGLGVVPALSSREFEQISMSGQEHLLENFRLIRTNLLSMGGLTKTPQVIMVTSSLPKEGKTVVSSNLALSFAQMGAKTLLIDGDLRRGRIHRLFGLSNPPGLSYVLTGKNSLEEACRSTPHENLHVLTAGTYLDAGSELLSSSKFGDILHELRGKYERIIVDTPPVLGLSETSMIQQLMDGVVFVAWSGRTPVKTMQMAIDTLQNNGANFYGFVLNRLDLSSATNYYRYYYYSNEYYRNYHALENA